MKSLIITSAVLAAVFLTLGLYLYIEQPDLSEYNPYAQVENLKKELKTTQQAVGQAFKNRDQLYALAIVSGDCRNLGQICLVENERRKLKNALDNLSCEVDPKCDVKTLQIEPQLKCEQIFNQCMAQLRQPRR